MWVDRKCENKRCGITFPARSADVKRGWARFCSKSCKAVVQEAKTGQYAGWLHRSKTPLDKDSDSGACLEYGEEFCFFNDAHLFSNEEYDGNKE